MRTSGNCTWPSSSHGRSCSRAQALHLFDVAIGPSVAVLVVAIPFLQELLILPLQLVVQEDAVDVCTLFAQVLGLLQIGSVDLGVVRQLPRLVNAVVEGLTIRCVGIVTPRLEQVSPLLRQGDDGRVAVELNGVNEA